MYLTFYGRRSPSAQQAMMCFFEASAKDKDRIDLMLTENAQKVFGYE